jgi:CHAD domain-containing protein
LGAQPLVAQYQLSPFARIHHAFGVRVAAAAGVAFRRDQHVLAERGQVMAANRTPVRRGLAIGRATHRPPWGRRKAWRGHSPIVAPLGATLVAVGVGVALALAKTQLQRRSSPAARSEPERRRPALLPGEPYAEGLRRVILGQLDLAVTLLESYPGGTGEHTVHETRKALKRLRALLVLLRAELGGKRYARENATLRDCGRRLAGARDAEVMLGTLDSLVQRDPSRFTRSAAVRTLRSQLLAERDTAAAHAIHDPRVRGEVVIELRAVRARAARWELRERGFRLFAPGLEDIYTRGRRRMRVARRRAAAERPGKGSRRGKHSRRAGVSVEALHVWRKHVKELRYATETLDRGGKSYKPVRRVARRADQLGEMLGEEHDLALLEARVRERSRQFAGERKTRKRLLALIASRRRKLRKRALREGERLYQRPPRRFVRRLKRAQ